jgi:hypothetical protein
MVNNNLNIFTIGFELVKALLLYIILIPILALQDHAYYSLCHPQVNNVLLKKKKGNLIVPIGRKRSPMASASFPTSLPSSLAAKVVGGQEHRNTIPAPPLPRAIRILDQTLQIPNSCHVSCTSRFIPAKPSSRSVPSPETACSIAPLMVRRWLGQRKISRLPWYLLPTLSCTHSSLYPSLQRRTSETFAEAAN